MILFGKEITRDSYPLYVAELSCNHGGSLQQAKELIHAAKEAGADAVKIQCYTPDEMTMPYNFVTNTEFVVKEGPWKNQHLYDLYSETQTPYDWIDELFICARDLKIPIFSSVFGDKGLDELEFLSCPAYKIASFENNDTELITKVVKTGKPVLISTGMASVQDINRIVSIVKPENTVLMHCVSAYPTKLHETNLWKINFLKGLYPITVGYSDHTVGYDAGVSATVLGAKVVEKHMMLPGTSTEDELFSCTPEEFSNYIMICNDAWRGVKNSNTDPEESSRQFRRSLYIVEDMEPGEQFTSKNVRSIRPSYGLEPYRYQEVLTKWAKVYIKAGTALREEHLSHG